MNRAWGGGAGVAERMPLLVAAAVVATMGLISLLFIPLLVSFLPWWIRWYATEWGLAAVAAGYALTRSLGNSRHRSLPWIDRTNRTLDQAETVSGRLLERWLMYGVAGLSVLWLLLWIPHYVYWPWCRDTDSYALMAQEWDAGVLPFRDIRSFNFPGHIYLHWVLGKLFGWGRTGLFNAVDAVALVLLGVLVLAWSRRRLGHVLPGMIAYLGFLAYYLDISFENVGERDWHAPLCVVVGLILLDAWPGRRSRWLSAVLAAAAFTIRPNVVLFFPALLFAAMTGDPAARDDEAPGGSRLLSRRTVLPGLEWLGVLVVFIGVGFLPLIVSGLVGDFIRGLEMLRPGGSHSDASLERSLRILLETLRQPKFSGLAVSLLLLALKSSDRNLKASAIVWLPALAGAMMYRPIHPLDHEYLRTPLALVAALAWAIPLAWLVRAAGEEVHARHRLAALPTLFGILLIVYELIPFQMPGNCNLRVSVDSVRAAATGGWPSTPPGAWVWYESYRSPYRWDPYCRLLNYVRETTTPTTIVANVLKRHPFPSTNGVIGRRSPFRVESGLPWTLMVAEDLDEEFARDLERQGCDSVVIYAPEETDPEYRLGFRRLTQVIHDRYVPEARFGMFEVWRRRCGPTKEEPAGPPAPNTMGRESRDRLDRNG